MDRLSILTQLLNFYKYFVENLPVILFIINIINIIQNYINQMNKLLISENITQTRPNTFNIQLTQSTKYLNILRDSHFKQVTVIPNLNNFNINQYKFLIHVSRILSANGLLVIQINGLEGSQITSIKKIVSNLGYFDVESKESELRYSKINLASNIKLQQKQNALSIGFKKIEISNEQIDQDELLKGDKIQKKSKPQNCQTKPKACSNCSCGRKQQQQKITKQQAIKSVQQGKIKSNCGNCALGDAFRCGTCPYKGLPAFKPGEKIQINLKQQIEIQSEAGKVQITGGKVKLQI